MQMDNNLESTQAQLPNVSFIENFKNETQSLNQEELSNYSKKLNYLCKSFNPFDTAELPDEIEVLLREFKLVEHSTNPYNFTNIALQMLDILESATTRKLN